MPINTDFLDRRINTLESVVEQLQQREPGDTLFDTLRAASVKEFEIVLEQSGNLLKKRLRPYFASNRQADRLTFKNVFRHTAKHDLISVEACERWFAYRTTGTTQRTTTERASPRRRSDCCRTSSSMPGSWQGSYPRQWMTDRLDLPLRYRRELEALLREHVPDAEVWAYGSRVSGESHPASDLDLVLRGPNLEPLSHGFSDLLEALEDSNIPILVQAHDWARLPERFHREIERDYVVLQEGATLTGWRETTFGDCAELVRDTVSPSNFKEAPYVGLEHIGEGTLSLLGVGVASDVSSAKSRFKRDDILFGKLRPYFRKVVRARSTASALPTSG